ncbi:DUF898 family protein [Sneathiella sp.]|uniref:DUF898 family protein n=1 Tax=Sneathiella sp. TaxID=1964365 RepID=UPI00356452E2
MTSSDTGSLAGVDQKAVAVSTTGGAGASQITFAVSRKHLLIRLIKNKIFGILTFGIYRFWGKTHVRRLLWQGTVIENDRLEYTGTAKELFLGFLVAMIILLPLMLVVSLAVKLLTVSGPASGLISQVANFAFLYMFWQFARYRLWRYRLSRTSWRGIRFYLSGSAMAYAGQVLLWTVLSIVTLGWAYPWLRAFRLNYQLNNTHFGDGRFTYQGTVGGLFRIYWPAILIAQLSIVAVAMYIYQTDAISLSFSGLAVSKSKLTGGDHAILILGLGGLFLFLMLSILSFAVRVWEFRYLAGVTHFLGAAFSSRLTIRSVLSVFLLLLFMGFVAYLGFALLVITVIKFQTSATAFVLVLALFVAYLGFDILKTLYLIVPLVSAICRSLHIYNVEIFEETAASSEKAPRYGEGFADALDVGAF